MVCPKRTLVRRGECERALQLIGERAQRAHLTKTPLLTDPVAGLLLQGPTACLLWLWQVGQEPYFTAFKGLLAAVKGLPASSAGSRQHCLLACVRSREFSGRMVVLGLLTG